ncbi:MAG: hypothetical protein K5756_01315 [Clostridiales bacterium]|nr:hypothetical protein [Clostridiales bacterium]
MKERIIGAVMIVVILIGFASYSGTFAWLRANIDDNASSADLTVGRMFSIEGELGSKYSMGNKKIMVPGENLIVRPLEEGEAGTPATAGLGTNVTEDGYEPCKLSIKNNSTIETQLRVKIEYSYPQYVNSQVEIVGLNPLCVYGNTDTNRPTDPNHRLVVAFTDSDKWVYDQTDGFWYYNPEEATSEDDDYLIVPADYSDQDLIDYICYDPVYYTETNNYNVWKDQQNVRTEVQVRLTVQAKQARYADWDDIGWGTIAEQTAILGA